MELGKIIIIQVLMLTFLTVANALTNDSRTEIPGTIEAENFKRFNDSTRQHFGDCGSGPVDQQYTEDPTGGGCHIAWTTPGEWLEYDIQAPKAGHYDILLRLASQTAGKYVEIIVDDKPAGVVRAPGKGRQIWENAGAERIYLEAGSHTLRVRFWSIDTNLNYIQLVQSPAAPLVTSSSDNG